MGDWLVYFLCTDGGKPVKGVKVTFDVADRTAPVRTTGMSGYGDGQVEFSRIVGLGTYQKIPNGDFYVKFEWAGNTKYMKIEGYSDRCDIYPTFKTDINEGVRFDPVGWIPPSRPDGMPDWVCKFASWWAKDRGLLLGTKIDDNHWKKSPESQADPWKAACWIEVRLDNGGRNLLPNPTGTEVPG